MELVGSVTRVRRSGSVVTPPLSSRILIRTFRCSSRRGVLSTRSLRESRSPRVLMSSLAILFCCFAEQCISMLRITGRGLAVKACSAIAATTSPKATLPQRRGTPPGMR